MGAREKRKSVSQRGEGGNEVATYKCVQAKLGPYATSCVVSFCSELEDKRRK